MARTADAPTSVDIKIITAESVTTLARCLARLSRHEAIATHDIGYVGRGLYVPRISTPSIITDDMVKHSALRHRATVGLIGVDMRVLPRALAIAKDTVATTLAALPVPATSNRVNGDQAFKDRFSLLRRVLARHGDTSLKGALVVPIASVDAGIGNSITHVIMLAAREGVKLSLKVREPGCPLGKVELS